MVLFLPCLALLLVSAMKWTSAVEVTPSSWRCVESGKALNLTSMDCTCKNTASNSSMWTNVDCTRRNFTNFAPNTTLPLFIERLDLSSNNITFLGESPFQHWNPLKELILSNNGMVSIIDNPFAGLESLRILDLSYNLLTVLPSNIFSKNKRLLSVNFNFNNLDVLPPEIFNTTKHIQSILLNHNFRIGKYISNSPQAISQALSSGLKRLELNHVNLSVIPNNLFTKAFSLSELFLSDNPFRNVPDLFIGGLEVLNMSGCDIERINTGNFISLPSIKELYLDRLISLTEVQEGAFDGLDSLRTVSMENCVQLKSFHGLAFRTKVNLLNRLSLVQGGLQTLSPELQPTFKGVGTVELHGNPWHCDCNLAWILKLNLTIHERKKLRCFSPPHLRGVRIFSLAVDDLQCIRPVTRVRSGLLVAMAVLLGMMCIAMIVGALDFVRRHRLKSSRRVGRYQPIAVQLEANRAEYDWEDKELTGPSVTQTSASQ